MNDTEKFIKKTLELLEIHSKNDFLELYRMLFTECVKIQSLELGRHVISSLVIESFRTKETWAYEEFLNSKDERSFLKKIGELHFIERLYKILTIEKEKEKKRTRFAKGDKERYILAEIIFKKYNPMYQFREYASANLCACCNQFVLSADEIQNFPLENSNEYILNTVVKAMKENEVHKREYLGSRLLCEYLKRNGVTSLFVELLRIIISNGVVANVFYNEEDVQKLLKYLGHKEIFKILKQKHPYNDRLIDDLLELFFKEGKYDLAFFLSAKMSSTNARFFALITNLISSNCPAGEKIKLVKRLFESVKSET